MPIPALISRRGRTGSNLPPSSAFTNASAEPVQNDGEDVPYGVSLAWDAVDDGSYVTVEYKVTEEGTDYQQTANISPDGGSFTYIANNNTAVGEYYFRLTRFNEGGQVGDPVVLGPIQTGDPLAMYRVQMTQPDHYIFDLAFAPGVYQAEWQYSTDGIDWTNGWSPIQPTDASVQWSQSGEVNTPFTFGQTYYMRARRKIDNEGTVTGPWAEAQYVADYVPPSDIYGTQQDQNTLALNWSQQGNGLSVYAEVSWVTDGQPTTTIVNATATAGQATVTQPELTPLPNHGDTVTVNSYYVRDSDNTQGQSSGTDIVWYTDNPAGGTLQVYALSTSEIRVDYDNAGYAGKIDYSTDYSNWTDLTNWITGDTTNTITHNSLPPNTQYFYRLTLNNRGNTQIVAEANATTFQEQTSSSSNSSSSGNGNTPEPSSSSSNSSEFNQTPEPSGTSGMSEASLDQGGGPIVFDFAPNPSTTSRTPVVTMPKYSPEPKHHNLLRRRRQDNT